MSFIRCLSNPEGLYIYHDTGNFICFSGGTIPRGHMRSGPVKDWYKLLDKCEMGWNDNAEAGAYRIRQILVKTGPRVDDNQPEPGKVCRWCKGTGKIIRRHGKIGSIKCFCLKPCWFQPGDYKMELTFKDMFSKKRVRILMWEVTWHYILAHGRCPGVRDYTPSDLFKKDKRRR